MICDIHVEWSECVPDSTASLSFLELLNNEWRLFGRSSLLPVQIFCFLFSKIPLVSNSPLLFSVLFRIILNWSCYCSIILLHPTKEHAIPFLISVSSEKWAAKTRYLFIAVPKLSSLKSTVKLLCISVESGCYLLFHISFSLTNYTLLFPTMFLFCSKLFKDFCKYFE